MAFPIHGLARTSAGQARSVNFVKKHTPRDGKVERIGLARHGYAHEVMTQVTLNG